MILDSHEMGGLHSRLILPRIWYWLILHFHFHFHHCHTIDCLRHLVTALICSFSKTSFTLLPCGNATNIGIEATYDCFPPLVSNNSNYPILDDLFIVGGATMATAATTASLGKIHLIVGSTLFQTTFGIPTNIKRFWFNLSQRHLLVLLLPLVVVVVFVEGT